jgi:hypothetical protein
VRREAKRAVSTLFSVLAVDFSSKMVVFGVFQGLPGPKLLILLSKFDHGGRGVLKVTLFSRAQWCRDFTDSKLLIVKENFTQEIGVVL